MGIEIAEIFCSIQGEGLRQGRPAVFIRCSGCNLRCDFCDTKDAWGKGNFMEEDRILESVGSFGIDYVVITGGEPLIRDPGRLVSKLKEKKYTVSLETNGTIFQKLDLDWLTVSPKKEGIKHFKNGYDERYRNLASEFKYVICRADDIDFIDRDITVPVILQPVDNDVAVGRVIAEKMQDIKMPNWYLRFQLHKILGIK